MSTAQVESRPLFWIAVRCDESFHSFKRDDNGFVQAYHSDDEICEAIEFNLSEVLGQLED